jgi:hypothetical protein
MGGERKVYTLPEVSDHNSPKDCWLVIDGKVCHIPPHVTEPGSCIFSVIFSRIENIMSLFSNGQDNWIWVWKLSFFVMG